MLYKIGKAKTTKTIGEETKELIDSKGYKFVIIFGSQDENGSGMEAYCTQNDIYENPNATALAMIVKMARRRENEKEVE